MVLTKSYFQKTNECSDITIKNRVVKTHTPKIELSNNFSITQRGLDQRIVDTDTNEVTRYPFLSDRRNKCFSFLSDSEFLILPQGTGWEVEVFTFRGIASSFKVQLPEKPLPSSSLDLRTSV